MLLIQHISTRIVVVGTTLIIAGGLAASLIIHRHQVVTSIATPGINHPPERALELPPPLQEQPSPEAQAVRLAEDFITANGYTDLPPDRNKLTHESIEPTTNVDELIKWRHNSLEREAFGVIPMGTMGGPGWTVVFRMKPTKNKETDSWGRAVTMDAALSHVRMQHKSIFLDGRSIKRL